MTQTEQKKHQLAIITQTQALIAAGDITGAEYALTNLADAQGDAALMVILDQLPAKDILAIVREYDPSRESIVGMLLTPKQFARAVVIEKQYKDVTRSHLRGMMNAVLFRGDAEMADTIDFLTHIGDLEGGSSALADYFSDTWARLEAFARTGHFDAAEEDGAMLSEAALYNNAYTRAQLDLDEVSDRDWMQLAYILRYQLPDLFIETLLVLRAKVRAFENGHTMDSFSNDNHHLQDHAIETSSTDRGKATPVARDSDDELAI